MGRRRCYYKRGQKFALVALGALTALLLAYSCGSGKQHLPVVSGKTGEVVVVASKQLWNSELGEAFRAALSDDYPFLPQSEPSFNLVNISSDMFSKAFQIHRNLILVEADKHLHPEVQLVVQRDVWARTQIVLKLSGPSIAALADYVRTQKSHLWTLLDQAEVDRHTQNARKYADPALRALVEERFGLSLSVPDGYHRNNPAGNPDSFVWFGYNTNFASLGIFVYAYPYTDTAQLSAQALNAKRQELLQQHVPSLRENSYMTTSPYVEPEYTPLRYKGMFLGRLRGLWEVYNGYMGGPFVSYSTVVGNRVVTVEGYVHAPKTDKRSYVRQMVGILFTIVPERETTDSLSRQN